jgi:hypothetical protein
VAPRILSHPKLLRFSDCGNDYDHDNDYENDTDNDNDCV